VHSRVKALKAEPSLSGLRRSKKVVCQGKDERREAI
jgi:hypothetical protein